MIMDSSTSFLRVYSTACYYPSSKYTKFFSQLPFLYLFSFLFELRARYFENFFYLHKTSLVLSFLLSFMDQSTIYSYECDNRDTFSLSCAFFQSIFIFSIAALTRYYLQRSISIFFSHVSNSVFSLLLSYSACFNIKNCPLCRFFSFVIKLINYLARLCRVMLSLIIFSAFSEPIVKETRCFLWLGRRAFKLLKFLLILISPCVIPRFLTYQYFLSSITTQYLLLLDPYRSSLFIKVSQGENLYYSDKLTDFSLGVQIFFTSIRERGIFLTRLIYMSSGRLSFFMLSANLYDITLISSLLNNIKSSFRQPHIKGNQYQSIDSSRMNKQNKPTMQSMHCLKIILQQIYIMNQAQSQQPTYSIDPNILQNTFNYSILRFSQLLYQPLQPQIIPPNLSTQTFSIPKELYKQLQLLIQQHKYHKKSQ